jgi:hypothetical protein
MALCSVCQIAKLKIKILTLREAGLTFKRAVFKEYAGSTNRQRLCLQSQRRQNCLKHGRNQKHPFFHREEAGLFTLNLMVKNELKAQLR